MDDEKIEVINHQSRKMMDMALEYISKIDLGSKTAFEHQTFWLSIKILAEKNLELLTQTNSQAENKLLDIIEVAYNKSTGVMLFEKNKRK